MGIMLNLYNKLTGYNEKDAILKRWQELNPNIKYDERLHCFTDWPPEKLSKISDERIFIIGESGEYFKCRITSENLIGDIVCCEILGRMKEGDE